jgi:enoyl-CoA hydratase
MTKAKELDGVLYETDGPIATITLNRPEYRNAQNSAMLYALDEAFYTFAQDDDLRVAVLRGAGASFSSGHDLGSPGMDYEVSFPRWSMWWDHVGKEGAENWMAREEEIYLGLSRRWRDIPKPTIAMVQGACVAGGLMLAWPCDLIYASDDAYFSDPVVLMGVCGVELFAHPWEMGVRQAKELLFTAGKLDAERAHQLGMVNGVFPLSELESRTYEIAQRIAQAPKFALALTKKAINQAQESMGYRAGIDAAFGLHQLAQVHNALTTGAPGLGQTASSMKEQTNR